MDTRKYTVNIDHHYEILNLQLTNDKKQLTIFYKKNDGNYTITVSLDGDELLIDNIALSNDRNKLYYNTLYIPCNVSSPKRVTMKFSKLI